MAKVCAFVLSASAGGWTFSRMKYTTTKGHSPEDRKRMPENRKGGSRFKSKKEKEAARTSTFDDVTEIAV